AAQRGTEANREGRYRGPPRRRLPERARTRRARFLREASRTHRRQEGEKNLIPSPFPCGRGTIARGPAIGTAENLILVLDASPADVVVEINVGRVFVARFFVRAVAKGFILRESARADVNRQLGAFRYFVRRVLFVSDDSGHE